MDQPIRKNIFTIAREKLDAERKFVNLKTEQKILVLDARNFSQQLQDRQSRIWARDIAYTEAVEKFHEQNERERRNKHITPEPIPITDKQTQSSIPCVPDLQNEICMSHENSPLAQTSDIKHSSPQTLVLTQPLTQNTLPSSASVGQTHVKENPSPTRPLVSLRHTPPCSKRKRNEDCHEDERPPKVAKTKSVKWYTVERMKKRKRFSGRTTNYLKSLDSRPRMKLELEDVIIAARDFQPYETIGGAFTGRMTRSMTTKERSFIKTS